MKKIITMVLAGIMLLTGCGKSKASKEDLLVNKTVGIDNTKIQYIRYTTEEELKESYNNIVNILNNSSFNNQQEYYNLKKEAISYADSYISMYGSIQGAYDVNKLIVDKLGNLDQDQDGVKDYFEVFVSETSPFRKISDERTGKDDGTHQNTISLYIIDGKVTPLIFGDVIKQQLYKGYTPPDNYIYFDLLLRSNELQAIDIKITPPKVPNAYPISFRIEGMYTPKVRGTATFYHHTKPSSDTNYIIYNNTQDNYLERSKEYTRTVSELFTDTDYTLVW